jgi:hypothetical protein
VCWCGKPHVARGLCDRHYSQAKRLGFPDTMGTLVLHRRHKTPKASSDVHPGSGADTPDC